MSNKVRSGLKLMLRFIANVRHDHHLCRYIFAKIREVYTLHFSEILPQLVTSILDCLFYLFVCRKTFTLQKFLQRTMRKFEKNHVRLLQCSRW